MKTNRRNGMRLENRQKIKFNISLKQKVFFSILLFILAFGGIYLYNISYPTEVKAKKERKIANFLDGYNYRKKIVLNDNEICGNKDFKDFVFLYSTTDPDLRHTSSDGHVSNIEGYDISFTNNSGDNTVAHEIEEYDPKTGKLVAWVHIKSLQHKSTNELYIYYSNQGINSDISQSPWPTQNKGVWHLGEALLNSKDNITGISNNTTIENDGKIGKARYFNGSNAYLDYGISKELNINDNITVSTWAKYEGGNGHLVNMGGGWDDPGYSLFWLGNSIRAELQRKSPTEKVYMDNSAPKDGKWHQITFTWDKKSKTIKTYIDGTQAKKTGIFKGPIGNSLESLNIGRKEQNGYYFKGFIDECRVLSSTLSSDQICTEYNNQNNPAEFCSIDEEEENECTTSINSGTISTSSSLVNDGEFVVLNLTGQSNGVAVQWESSKDNINFKDIRGKTTPRINSSSISSTTYFRATVDNGKCKKYTNTVSVDIHVRFLGLYGFRKKIKINKSMVAGNDGLENFPVLIKINDNSLKSKENGGNVYRSNGHDIVFADAAGNFHKHEKEKYDPVTGNLIAWVRIPKLTNGEDKTFYLYYGNCDASTNTNPSTYTTWPEDYRGIWHFNNNFLDATSNANDGTNVNSSDEKNGKIGNARSFNGSNQYINITSNNSLKISEAITISSWVYHKGGNGHILNKGGGWYEDGYSFFYLSNKLRVELQKTSPKKITIADNSVSSGSWQHLAMTWNKKIKKITTYVNGKKASVIKKFKGPIGTSDQNLNIGRNEKRGYYFNGLIDEARISASLKSETWIASEFNNQSNPSQYIEISDEEREIAWVGGNSVDWQTPTNWCNCQVPAKGENIRIPSRMNKPKLDQNRIIGNLLIEDNASLNLNGKKLSVERNIVIEGSLIHGNGELEFSGSTSQMISSSSKITASKLTINNSLKKSPAVTINTDLSITKELSLTNGIVNIYSGKMIIIEDDATSNMGSKTSFVEGKIRKNGDDAFIFPIGKSGEWAKIEISAPTSSSSFEAEYYNTPYHLREKMDLTVKKISSVEHWILDKVAGNGKVRVSLYWENANRSGITDLTSLMVIKRDDIEDKWIGLTQFAPPTGEVGEGGGGKIICNDLLDRFSPFTFGSSSTGNALPIELHSFNVNIVDGDVHLDWKTATEINNDYFTVERSTDNANYAPILTVKGAGNSTSMLSYQAVDESPFDGVSYYRLKQTDYDGKFEYFDVKSVQFTTEANLFEISEIYPNPFQNSINVNFNSEAEGSGEFNLIDYSGKNIATVPITIQKGTNHYNYNGSNLVPGVYLAYLTLGENKTEIYKVIKK